MILMEEMRKIFPSLEKYFTKKELFEFMNTPNEDLDDCYSKFGLWIKTNLLRNDRSILRPLFLRAYICDLDCMSSIIMQKFYRYLFDKKKNIHDIDEDSESKTISLLKKA